MTLIVIFLDTFVYYLLTAAGPQYKGQIRGTQSSTEQRLREFHHVDGFARKSRVGFWLFNSLVCC